MKKVILVTTLLLFIVGIIAVVLFLEPDNKNSGRKKPDITWSEAEKLISACEVKSIDYLGGVTADGVGSSDEGLAYITLRDKTTKLIEPDPNWDFAQVQNLCGISVTMP